MDVGKLKHKVQLWGKVKEKNELGETKTRSGIIKSLWAEIIPQTGRMQNAQVETILSKTTHKFIIRYNAGKDIAPDMWFMFRGKRLDIKFILNPYFSNEKLEIFCEEVIE